MWICLSIFSILSIFASCILKCCYFSIHISNWCIFLVGWPFFLYVISLFVPSNFTWCIFWYFYFQSTYAIKFDVSFLWTVNSWVIKKINSTNLYYLVSVFRPLTSNVITDNVRAQFCHTVHCTPFFPFASYSSFFPLHMAY